MADKIVTNSIKLINTTGGRDKLCRLFQYFTKFLIPILVAQGDRYKSLLEKSQALNKQMGLTRKTLRFGRSLPVLKTMMDRIKTHESKPVRMIFLRTISDLLLAAYYLSDHPLFFNKLGLYTFEPKTLAWLEFISDFLWLIEACIDVICDLVDLYAIQKQI